MEFQNDPFKNVSEYEHDMALNRAVKWTENILSETFGTDVSKLTLVCLTASTRMKMIDVSNCLPKSMQ